MKNVSSSGVTSNATIAMDRGNVAINCANHFEQRQDWNITQLAESNCTCQTSWLLVLVLTGLIGQSTFLLCKLTTFLALLLFAVCCLVRSKSATANHTVWMRKIKSQIIKNERQ